MAWYNFSISSSVQVVNRTIVIDEWVSNATATMSKEGVGK